MSRSIMKMHSLQDLLMITWMRKGRKKNGDSFKGKNLFTELKVELETHFQILDLLFNFKNPSALMA